MSREHLISISAQKLNQKGKEKYLKRIWKGISQQNYSQNFKVKTVIKQIESIVCCSMGDKRVYATQSNVCNIQKMVQTKLLSLSWTSNYLELVITYLPKLSYAVSKTYFNAWDKKDNTLKFWTTVKIRHFQRSNNWQLTYLSMLLFNGHIRTIQSNEKKLTARQYTLFAIIR